MKTGISFSKKMRKAMTLLELVVAMALTSIVLAGAAVALFAVNRTSQQETRYHVSMTDAKNLCYVIDLLFKDKDRGVIDVEIGDNLGKENYSKLFTITKDEGTYEYGLNKTVFGISSGDDITEKNQKYVSSYEMYLTVTKRPDNKFVEFVIHYGVNYSSSMSLVERI